MQAEVETMTVCYDEQIFPFEKRYYFVLKALFA